MDHSDNIYGVFLECAGDSHKVYHANMAIGDIFEDINDNKQALFFFWRALTASKETKSQTQKAEVIDFIKLTQLHRIWHLMSHHLWYLVSFDLIFRRILGYTNYQ